MKRFSKQALDALQPTSALTKATADGYCPFQDEINTPDPELSELRKKINGETRNTDDRYFEEGSLRHGLFNNEFDDDNSKVQKKSSKKLVQTINFYTKQDHEENEHESKSDQNQAAQTDDQMIIQISNNNRSKLKINTSLLKQGAPDSGSKQSERSKGTSLNDLTLSDEPDSQSVSDRDARKLSKPRSEQESGMKSGIIGSQSIVQAMP